MTDVGWSQRVSAGLARWPGLVLLALVLPLLLLGWGQASPMPHDEGYYALQGRWMLETGDWLTPYWWDQPVFDRAIGAQWLIALSYRLFGYGNVQAHLPSLGAAIATVLLTFAIGRQLLPRRIAWVGALILALTPLWVSYAHLATQDMLLLAIELAGIYGLIRSGERSPLWSGLAGTSIGLAFWIKGFMVAVPVLALLPYVWVARRSLLKRPAFWAGLGLGWLPVLLWLQISLQRWGLPVVAGLLDKMFLLSKVKQDAPLHALPWYYYLWNVPANAAPWSLLVPLGGWRVATDAPTETPQAGKGWLLLGYPLALLLLLSLFNTKTPYYGLQLMPFLALLSAVGLTHLVQYPQWTGSVCIRRGTVGLALVLLFGTLLLGTGLIPLQPSSLVVPITLAAGLIGVSWLVLLRARTPARQLACWFTGPWLALVLAGQLSLWTDHEPALLQGLAAIAQPLQQSVVDFRGPLQETRANQQAIVLALAAPQLGRRLDETAPLRGLTWQSPEVSRPPDGSVILATLDGWTLLAPDASQHP